MQESNDKDVKEILHEKTILFLRDEVDRRYRLEYMQQIPALTEEEFLEGITEEMVDRVKNFFRDVLYPIGEDRKRRDEHVDRVTSMLNNPGRLMELLPRVPFFILRHGSSLVTATRAGLKVISTHRLSVRIEQEVTEHLYDVCREEELEIDEQRDIPKEVFQEALTRVPKRQAEHMVDHLKKITRLAMQPTIILASKELFHEIRKSLHTEDEQEAIDYALWVMDQLEIQVRDYDKELMKRLLTIAEVTEQHYLEELYGNHEYTS
jgi:hypothetical protein